MSKYPVEQITLPFLHFMLMNVEADFIKNRMTSHLWNFYTCKGKRANFFTG